MAGIYVHIPFCKQKCTYCDFHFSTTFSAYRNKMIAALVEELKSRKSYFANEKIETIYFGGGTPSLLTNEELQLICDTIRMEYSLNPEIEFTLEANPDDINEQQLISWKSVGINRLSIGLQSFFQEDLNWMNRVHTVEEGRNAVKLAKKHNFFLTLDLIYGLPNHTIKELEYNVQQMVELAPEHISAYCLTAEKGTALTHLIQTGKLPKVEENEQAEEFEFLVDYLKSYGYQQYEISNFAKDDRCSQHNSNYWRGKSYIGIGPSAHSFNGEKRRWNVSNNTKYIKGVLGNSVYYEEEILTAKDRFNELLLTGLRTKWGVNLKTLYSLKEPTNEFHFQLEEFKKYKLLFKENETILLTETGKLQADYIASSLFSD